MATWWPKPREPVWRVEDFLHRLRLDEVVARTQRAQLGRAALAGTGAEGAGCIERQAAARLDELHVGRLAAETAHDLAHAAGDEALKLLLVQRPQPVRCQAGGNACQDGVADFVGDCGELAGGYGTGQQAHAAIDVVAHSARQDDAAGGGKGRHAADAEAIAVMDVGHGQRTSDEAGQAGHVDHLLDRGIIQRVLQDLACGEDLGIGGHGPVGRPAQAPATGGDLLEVHRAGFHTSKTTAARSMPFFSLTRRLW
ncbi:MAG: hypothetical protein MUF02_09600 [Acidobacteria bacterium]|nr:hypothetical protein [Acidobacteriota bacterium]